MSTANPALAGDKGKTPGSCSNPYTLATYNETGNLYVGNDVYAPNAELVQSWGADVLFALFQSIDHNGDSALCFKVPHGWTEGNTLNRTDLVNLVDDKS